MLDIRGDLMNNVISDSQKRSIINEHFKIYSKINPKGGNKITFFVENV